MPIRRPPDLIHQPRLQLIAEQLTIGCLSVSVICAQRAAGAAERGVAPICHFDRSSQAYQETVVCPLLSYCPHTAPVVRRKRYPPR